MGAISSGCPASQDRTHWTTRACRGVGKIGVCLINTSPAHDPHYRTQTSALKRPCRGPPCVRRTQRDRTRPRPAVAHPTQALQELAAQALGIATNDIASLQVFKRSFDARKAELLVVYIVDLVLADPQQTAALLQRFDQHPHIGPTPHGVPVGRAGPGQFWAGGW